MKLKEKKVEEFKARQRRRYAPQKYNKAAYAAAVLPMFLKPPTRRVPYNTGNGTPFKTGSVNQKLFDFFLVERGHLEFSTFLRRHKITPGQKKAFLKVARSGTHRGHAWSWNATERGFKVRYTRSFETYLAKSGGK